MLNLDSIYKEYAELVYKYSFSLCHEDVTAEELTQETFYQAVKSAYKYDGSCKVSTWLCQIAKHLWYQELEQRKKKGTTPLVEEIVSAEHDVAEKICLKEDVVNIFRRVHVLDDVSKEVFFLRITGELSFREIGEIFERNENWARVTFYRAKQKIMKGWGE